MSKQQFVNCAITALVAVALVSASLTFAQQEMMSPDPADLILRNGLIYTVDPTNTLTEAVAIRGGKFVFVGANKDVKKYKGKQTREIDLKGAFVLPGVQRQPRSFRVRGAVPRVQHHARRHSAGVRRAS